MDLLADQELVATIGELMPGFGRLHSALAEARPGHSSVSEDAILDWLRDTVIGKLCLSASVCAAYRATMLLDPGEGLSLQGLVALCCKLALECRDSPSDAEGRSPASKLKLFLFVADPTQRFFVHTGPVFLQPAPVRERLAVGQAAVARSVATSGPSDVLPVGRQQWLGAMQQLDEVLHSLAESCSSVTSFRAGGAGAVLASSGPWAGVAASERLPPDAGSSRIPPADFGRRRDSISSAAASAPVEHRRFSQTEADLDLGAKPQLAGMASVGAIVDATSSLVASLAARSRGHAGLTAAARLGDTTDQRGAATRPRADSARAVASPPAADGCGDADEAKRRRGSAEAVLLLQHALEVRDVQPLGSAEFARSSQARRASSPEAICSMGRQAANESNPLTRGRRSSIGVASAPAGRRPSASSLVAGFDAWQRRRKTSASTGPTAGQATDAETTASAPLPQPLRVSAVNRPVHVDDIGAGRCENPTASSQPGMELDGEGVVTYGEVLQAAYCMNVTAAEEILQALFHRYCLYGDRSKYGFPAKPAAVGLGGATRPLGAQPNSRLQLTQFAKLCADASVPGRGGHGSGVIRRADVDVAFNAALAHMVGLRPEPLGGAAPGAAAGLQSHAHKTGARVSASDSAPSGAGGSAAAGVGITSKVWAASGYHQREVTRSMLRMGLDYPAFVHALLQLAGRRFRSPVVVGAGGAAAGVPASPASVDPWSSGVGHDHIGTERRLDSTPLAAASLSAAAAAQDEERQLAAYYAAIDATIPAVPQQGYDTADRAAAPVMLEGVTSPLSTGGAGLATEQGSPGLNGSNAWCVAEDIASLPVPASLISSNIALRLLLVRCFLPLAAAVGLVADPTYVLRLLDLLPSAPASPASAPPGDSDGSPFSQPEARPFWRDVVAADTPMLHARRFASGGLEPSTATSVFAGRPSNLSDAVEAGALGGGGLQRRRLSIPGPGATLSPQLQAASTKQTSVAIHTEFIARSRMEPQPPHGQLSQPGVAAAGVSPVMLPPRTVSEALRYVSASLDSLAVKGIGLTAAHASTPASASSHPPAVLQGSGALGPAQTWSVSVVQPAALQAGSASPAHVTVRLSDLQHSPVGPPPAPSGAVSDAQAAGAPGNAVNGAPARVRDSPDQPSGAGRTNDSRLELTVDQLVQLLHAVAPGRLAQPASPAASTPESSAGTSPASQRNHGPLAATLDRASLQDSALPGGSTASSVPLPALASILQPSAAAALPGMQEGAESPAQPAAHAPLRHTSPPAPATDGHRRPSAAQQRRAAIEQAIRSVVSLLQGELGAEGSSGFGGRIRDSGGDRGRAAAGDGEATGADVGMARERPSPSTASSGRRALSAGSARSHAFLPRWSRSAVSGRRPRSQPAVQVRGPFPASSPRPHGAFGSSADRGLAARLSAAGRTGERRAGRASVPPPGTDTGMSAGFAGMRAARHALNGVAGSVEGEPAHRSAAGVTSDAEALLPNRHRDAGCGHAGAAAAAPSSHHIGITASSLSQPGGAATVTAALAYSLAGEEVSSPVRRFVQARPGVSRRHGLFSVDGTPRDPGIRERQATGHDANLSALEATTSPPSGGDYRPRPSAIPLESITSGRHPTEATGAPLAAGSSHASNKLLTPTMLHSEQPSASRGSRHSAQAATASPSSHAAAAPQGVELTAQPHPTAADARGAGIRSARASLQTPAPARSRYSRGSDTAAAVPLPTTDRAQREWQRRFMGGDARSEGSPAQPNSAAGASALPNGAFPEASARPSGRAAEAGASSISLRFDAAAAGLSPSSADAHERGARPAARSSRTQVRFAAGLEGSAGGSSFHGDGAAGAPELTGTGDGSSTGRAAPTLQSSPGRRPYPIAPHWSAPLPVVAESSGRSDHLGGADASYSTDARSDGDSSAALLDSSVAELLRTGSDDEGAGATGGKRKSTRSSGHRSVSGTVAGVSNGGAERGEEGESEEEYEYVRVGGVVAPGLTASSNLAHTAGEAQSPLARSSGFDFSSEAALWATPGAIIAVPRRKSHVPATAAKSAPEPRSAMRAGRADLSPSAAAAGEIATTSPLPGPPRWHGLFTAAEHVDPPIGPDEAIRSSDEQHLATAASLVERVTASQSTSSLTSEAVMRAGMPFGPHGSSQRHQGSSVDTDAMSFHSHSGGSAGRIATHARIHRSGSFEIETRPLPQHDSAAVTRELDAGLLSAAATQQQAVTVREQAWKADTAVENHPSSGGPSPRSGPGAGALPLPGAGRWQMWPSGSAPATPGTPQPPLPSAGAPADAPPSLAPAGVPDSDVQMPCDGAPLPAMFMGHRVARSPAGALDFTSAREDGADSPYSPAAHGSGREMGGSPPLEVTDSGDQASPQHPSSARSAPASGVRGHSYAAPPSFRLPAAEAGYLHAQQPAAAGIDAAGQQPGDDLHTGAGPSEGFAAAEGDAAAAVLAQSRLYASGVEAMGPLQRRQLRSPHIGMHSSMAAPMLSDHTKQPHTAARSHVRFAVPAESSIATFPATPPQPPHAPKPAQGAAASAVRRLQHSAAAPLLEAAVSVASHAAASLGRGAEALTAGRPTPTSPAISRRLHAYTPQSPAHSEGESAAALAASALSCRRSLHSGSASSAVAFDDSRERLRAGQPAGSALRSAPPTGIVNGDLWSASVAPLTRRDRLAPRRSHTAHRSPSARLSPPSVASPSPPRGAAEASLVAQRRAQASAAFFAAAGLDVAGADAAGAMPQGGAAAASSAHGTQGPTAAVGAGSARLIDAAHADAALASSSTFVLPVALRRLRQTTAAAEAEGSNAGMAAVRPRETPNRKAARPAASSGLGV